MLYLPSLLVVSKQNDRYSPKKSGPLLFSEYFCYKAGILQPTEPRTPAIGTRAIPRGRSLLPPRTV